MKYLMGLLGVLIHANLFAQFNTYESPYKAEHIELNIEASFTLNDFTPYDSVLLSTIEHHKMLIHKNIINNKGKEQSVSKSISLPLTNISINSEFGYRFHPIDRQNKFHYGIDLYANNDDVYSMVGGVIIDSGYNSSLGYYVIIEYKYYKFIYGHLREYYVKRGDEVVAGYLIGKTGSTGKSTGEHLHFAIKKNNTFINPLPFLKELANN